MHVFHSILSSVPFYFQLSLFYFEQCFQHMSKITCVPFYFQLCTQHLSNDYMWFVLYLIVFHSIFSCVFLFLAVFVLFLAVCSIFSCVPSTCPMSRTSVSTIRRSVRRWSPRPRNSSPSSTASPPARSSSRRSYRMRTSQGSTSFRDLTGYVNFKI